MIHVEGYPLRFGECVMGHLLTGIPVEHCLAYVDGETVIATEQARIGWRYDRQSKIMELTSDLSNGNYVHLLFRHKTECPAKSLKSKREQAPPLRVAVSVMLENSKGEILITRRAARLRSFPGSWVFPGGTVDAGEDLIDAAQREVFEEVGLEIEVESIDPICIWESTYPVLSGSDLTHHHVIVYYHAKISHGLECEMQVQVSEVDGIVWVSLEQIRAVLGSMGKGQGVHGNLNALSASIEFDQENWDTKAPPSIPMPVSFNDFAKNLPLGVQFAMEVFASSDRANNNDGTSDKA